MGFNTVAFILNDFSHELPESPEYVAFKLAHPPMCKEDAVHVEHQAMSVAREAGEKIPHHQALDVLPTFHADMRKFFTAGGNCISELKFVKTTVNRKTGKRCVVLELPEYLQDRKRF